MQTPEEIEQTVAGFRAWLEGKPAQFRYFDAWQDISKECGELMLRRTGDGRLRPKPTPRLRPWLVDEVPTTAVFRTSDQVTGFFSPSSVGEKGVWFVGEDGFGGASIVKASMTDLLHLYKHSTDGGKAWLPCGVLEDAP